MSDGNILQMQNIRKSFGGLSALVGVDLELRYREVLGLVGDNAAGKSTLMKILTGAYHADEGQIIFEGKPIPMVNPHISKRLGIEMVYQDFELCPNLDVPANLFLGREALSGFLFRFLRKKEMEKKAIRELKRLHIEIKNPRLKADKLSGGQQQAVAIAKAVGFNPQIVIMDEPTANLAQKEIDKVLDLTIRLKDHGIAVIFISHRLDDVLKVTDRIFVLRNGRRVTVLDTKQTNKDEVLRLMFIGDTEAIPQRN